jgi:hypothetical protein
VFALGCNDSSGPQAPERLEKQDAPEPSAAGACPEITFDSETGRMTIQSGELCNRIRTFYGIGPNDAGTGQAVVVFTADAASKAGGSGDVIRSGDMILNYRC